MARGQHRVLGGHPAQAGALAPARHALGRREAAHSTRVRPNSTSTEPSAWSSQSRVMVHRAELVVGAAVGAGHAGDPSCRTRVRASAASYGRRRVTGAPARAGRRRPRAPRPARPSRVVPRRHVGEHSRPTPAAARGLAGLAAGQVQVGRVVAALDERRLARAAGRRRGASSTSAVARRRCRRSRPATRPSALDPQRRRPRPGGRPGAAVTVNGPTVDAARPVALVEVELRGHARVGSARP